MKMYEILVPVKNNDGETYNDAFHRHWDRKVVNQFGGLTILSPQKGKWGNHNEEMIPVRIACHSIIGIKSVMRFTKEYYKQKRVMAYEVSPNVLFV